MRLIYAYIRYVDLLDVFLFYFELFYIDSTTVVVRDVVEMLQLLTWVNF